MFQQIRYFHAIVEHHSFTEAAAICHISQSAISQQIQSLEFELGFPLLIRQNRSFTLTKQGEAYYRETKLMVEQYDRFIKVLHQQLNPVTHCLKIGAILTYGDQELSLAINRFVQMFEDIEVQVHMGSHEDLYHRLTDGDIDLALNDQRRAFHSGYQNLILQQQPCMVEIAKSHPLAQMHSFTAQDLMHVPCIIVCEQAYEQQEQAYYRDAFGIVSKCIFARSLKDARLMVLAKRGYILIHGQPILAHFNQTIQQIPFLKNQQVFMRNLCCFYRDQTPVNEAFVSLLIDEFQKNQKEESWQKIF